MGRAWNLAGMREPLISDYQHELETASRLAREAGEVILNVYATDFTVASKGKAGPVTEADLQASHLIVEGLRKAFPGDAVVSEEDAASHVRHEGRVWYVDPLDGTKEFVARNGEFAVMIGLAIGGRASVGVVYRPVTGSLYSGTAGNETWLEEDGRRMQLSVSSTTDLRALRLAVSRSHRHSLLTELRPRLGITQEIPCGSVGLKVGLVAGRQADLYLDPSPYTNAWDTCGPEAILSGAGGKMTDLAGAPILYGRDELRNRKGLLGSNGACHDLVLQAIGPVVKAAGII